MPSLSSVQRPLQKKLADLTKQCEQHRTQIVELEGRLAETGQAALGLRELLEQCHNGLAAVVLSETASDHAPLPSLRRLKRLVC